MRFHDREHAGRLLAARLEHLKAAKPVVLGLTRGGIPVAFQVARGLGAPLDLVVVRRLRATFAPELSFGALAEGGVTYLNPTVLRDARMKQDDAAAIAAEMVDELARRVRLYRGEIPAPSLRDRTVILVDDFVSTGTSARAAALAARRRRAARVVLAVPVLAASVEPELRAELDDLVVLEASHPPNAPSDAYERLEDVTDEAAIEYLRRARLEGVLDRIAPAGMT